MPFTSVPRGARNESAHTCALLLYAVLTVPWSAIQVYFNTSRIVPTAVFSAIPAVHTALSGHAWKTFLRVLNTTLSLYQRILRTHYYQVHTVYVSAIPPPSPSRSHTPHRVDTCWFWRTAAGHIYIFCIAFAVSWYYTSTSIIVRTCCTSRPSHPTACTQGTVNIETTRNIGPTMYTVVVVCVYIHTVCS